MSLFAALRSWLSSWLQTLGFANKSATVIMLGLDNAGKTTLQYRLKTGQLQQFLPTQRAKEETMVVEGLTVRCWDLGGHQAARQLWAKYAAMADGLIFVVDAADGARIQEAAQELRALIGVLQPAGAADSGGGGGGGQAAAQHSSSVPVAILANKSDLKHALSPAALADALRLNELPYTRLRLFPASVIKGTGYQEAFKWIATFV